MRHGLAMMRLLPLRKCFAMALPAGLRACIVSSRDISEVTLPIRRSRLSDQGIRSRGLADKSFDSPAFGYEPVSGEPEESAQPLNVAMQRTVNQNNVLQSAACGVCETHHATRFAQFLALVAVVRGQHRNVFIAQVFSLQRHDRVFARSISIGDQLLAQVFFPLPVQVRIHGRYCLAACAVTGNTAFFDSQGLTINLCATTGGQERDTRNGPRSDNKFLMFMSSP